MSIDYSKIYSVLSSVEGKNQQEIEKIIEEFRQIKSLKTVNQAKDFLEQNYGVTNGSKNIKGLANVNIKESEKRFSVIMECQAQIIEYHFKKKENV